MGAYFSKIACFCFNEQTLQPGEEIEMPVTFYVDPGIGGRSGFQSIQTVTLSYNLLPGGEAAAAGGRGRARRRRQWRSDSHHPSGARAADALRSGRDFRERPSLNQT